MRRCPHAGRGILRTKDTLLHCETGRQERIDHRTIICSRAYANVKMKYILVYFILICTAVPRTSNTTLSNRTYATLTRDTLTTHGGSYMGHGYRVLGLPDVMENVYTRGSTRPVSHTRKPLEIPHKFNVPVAYPAIDYLITGHIGQMNPNEIMLCARYRISSSRPEITS